MANYNSQYTGAQIDEAVGKVLNNGVSTIITASGCMMYGDDWSEAFDISSEDRAKIDKSKSLMVQGLTYKPDWNEDAIDYTTCTAQAIIYKKGSNYYEVVKIFNYLNYSASCTISGLAGSFSSVSVSQNSEYTYSAISLGSTKPSCSATGTLSVTYDSTQTLTQTINQVGYDRDFHIAPNMLTLDAVNDSYSTMLFSSSLPNSIDDTIELKVVTTPYEKFMYGRIIKNASAEKTRINMGKFTFETTIKHSTSALGLKIATNLLGADKSKPIELYNFRLNSTSNSSNNICILSYNGNPNRFTGTVYDSLAPYTISIVANTDTTPYLAYYIEGIPKLGSINTFKEMNYFSDISPSPNGSYYLGDSSRWWAGLYANNIYSKTLRPYSNNTYSLGSSSYKYNYVYTNYLHNGSYSFSLPTVSANKTLAVTTDIPDVSGKANLTGGNTWSGLQRYNNSITPNTDRGCSLGSSAYGWSSVYARYLNNGATINIPTTSGTLALTSQIPTVNNPTITITQGGTTKGSFTLNQSSGATIALDAGGGSGMTKTRIFYEDIESSIGAGGSYTLTSSMGISTLQQYKLVLFSIMDYSGEAYTLLFSPNDVEGEYKCFYGGSVKLGVKVYTSSINLKNFGSVDFDIFSAYIIGYN